MANAPQRAEATEWPPGRLRLTSRDYSTPAFVDAYQRIIDHAATAPLLERSDRSRAIVVFRKSMRRGRALLALFRDDLPKETYRATRQSLGVAARSVSTLRDAEMFVGLVENLELSDAQRELARRATARRQQNSANQDAQKLLKRAVRVVRGSPARVSASLPQDLSPQHVQEGLVASYRRARRRLDIVHDSGDPEDFHTYRKRTKELTYQLELFASVGGEQARNLRREFSSFATRLGKVNDRAELAKFLRSFDTQPERLLADVVTCEWERYAERALEESQRLFAAKPKDFVSDFLAEVARGTGA